jgi:hypothetical protein
MTEAPKAREALKARESQECQMARESQECQMAQESQECQMAQESQNVRSGKPPRLMINSTAELFEAVRLGIVDKAEAGRLLGFRRSG